MKNSYNVLHVVGAVGERALNNPNNLNLLLNIPQQKKAYMVEVWFSTVRAVLNSRSRFF